MNFRNLITVTVTIALLCYSNNVFGQSTKINCTPEQKKECTLEQLKSCRGAQTKFSEAKVITVLRSELLDLKSKISLSDKININENNLVGETDDESLTLIISEVQLLENKLAENLNYRTKRFELPGSKAKQVAYLNARIQAMRQSL